MAELLHWLITLSEQGIWKEVPIFSKEHPYVSTVVLVILIFILCYALIIHAIEIVQKLLIWLPSRSWASIVTVLVLGAVAIGFILAISFTIVNTMVEATMPVPSLTVGKVVFVGEPIVLSWSFDKQGNDQPILFEIQSAKDKKFQDDLRAEAATDDEGVQIPRKIDGSRYWHVCAVKGEMKDGVLKAGTRFGRCSDPLLISQYENAISRINATCRVTIYVSSTYENGKFRFMNGSDNSLNGFDTKLAVHIASKIIEKLHLSDTCGKKVDTANIVPVSWSDLLVDISKGSADMAISAITRTKDREDNFRIRFSKSYYCTSQAIMWVGKRETQPLNKIMLGKRIGVQEKTTSENFVNYLSKKFGKGFVEIKKYRGVQEIVSALTSSEIDYGIADEPFAKSAGMRLHKAAETYFNFRKLNRDEYPIVDEEYAVAVSAREDKL